MEVHKCYILATEILHEKILMSATLTSVKIRCKSVFLKLCCHHLSIQKIYCWLCKKQLLSYILSLKKLIQKVNIQGNIEKYVCIYSRNNITKQIAMSRPE